MGEDRPVTITFDNHYAHSLSTQGSFAAAALCGQIC